MKDVKDYKNKLNEIKEMIETPAEENAEKENERLLRINEELKQLETEMKKE